MDRFDKRSATFVTFIENDSQYNAKRPSTGHILSESRNTDFNVHTLIQGQDGKKLLPAHKNSNRK